MGLDLRRMPDWLPAAILLAVIAFGPAFLMPTNAAAPLQRSEQNLCIIAVTPSSTTAAQFNSTNTFGGQWAQCNVYNEVCWTNESTVAGDVIYISTFNTTTAANGWPVRKDQAECHDWTHGIPLWYFQKAGQTGQTNALKFELGG